MKLRDKLYAIKEDALALINKPRVQRKVDRGIGSAIDSLETEKDKKLSRLDELERRLVNGDLDAIQLIVDVRSEIKEIDNQLEIIRDEQVKLDSEAPDEKTDKAK